MWIWLGLLALGFLLLVLWQMNHPALRKPQSTPFAETTTQMVQSGEWLFRCHISGRGPYILLLHGLGADLYCWRFLIPLLNRHHTVVALDLPGFGASSKPESASYGLEEQVQRIKALCTELGIEQTFLVGNSMGGNIALWYALTFPQQVLGTVVIAPATTPSLMPLDGRRWLWMARPLAKMVSRRALRWAHLRTVTNSTLVDGPRIDSTYETYARNPGAVRSFLLATESIRDPRLNQRLGELKTKVLILWGSRDRLVSRRVVDSLESLLALKESHVHVGGGHHLQEEEPAWVAEKIDAFCLEKAH